MRDGGFRPEAQALHPQAAEQLHRTGGKALGGAKAHRHRKLQDQIRPGQKGGFGPNRPVKDRRLAPLHIKSAHETHHRRLGSHPPDCLQLPGMAQVKRVILTDDSHRPHHETSHFLKKIPRKGL